MSLSFWSVSNCKEVAGRLLCDQCQQPVCEWHVLGTPPSLELNGTQLGVIEAIVSCYLTEQVRVYKDRFRLFEPTDRNYETYKTFFTGVLPELNTLSFVTNPPYLCLACAQPFVTRARDTILRSLMPVVQVYRKKGELCTNDSGVICFRDARLSCQNCGKARCGAHAARCIKCQQNFCCDSLEFVSSDWSSDYHKAHGACAIQHKHWFAFDEKGWKTVRF